MSLPVQKMLLLAVLMMPLPITAHAQEDAAALAGAMAPRVLFVTSGGFWEEPAGSDDDAASAPEAAGEEASGEEAAGEEAAGEPAAAPAGPAPARAMQRTPPLRTQLRNRPMRSRLKNRSPKLQICQIRK